jgi:hypothetical protein
MHFIKQKTCRSLTIYGWLFILILIVVVMILAIKLIHPFLAMNRPIYGGLLIVEGWTPDYVLLKAINEFQKNDYQLLITTGGPLKQGFHLSEYQTYAGLAAATLKKLGFHENLIISIPTPAVLKDRTYASALAVKKWLSTSDLLISSITIYTLGTHARRSRLLFEKAFEHQMSVGIIAVENLEYDSLKWWKSSSGVRSVLNETIAYLYARFFFYPNQFS